MTLRRIVLVALFSLVCALPSFAGDRYTTDNFVVDAPTRELAKSFGEYAEKYRKEKAVDWLGREMPRWAQRCPIRVQITLNSPHGATTFSFGPDDRGRSTVLRQEMEIVGPADKLLKSVLPHEITHTVLAHHFGQAVPRWADEGSSVLSENAEERYNHDVRCRELLNQGRGIHLRYLFTMTEYPRDVMVVYAQGYSLCDYLIEQGGRKKFLEFVGVGMKKGNNNWEEAAELYGYKSVDELEETWIAALKNPGTDANSLAKRNTPSDRGSYRGETAKTDRRGSTTALVSGRGLETRTSAVSAVPMLEPPIIARGATPGEERTRADRRDRDCPNGNCPRSASRPMIPQLLPPELPQGR